MIRIVSTTLLMLLIALLCSTGAAQLITYQNYSTSTIPYAASVGAPADLLCFAKDEAGATDIVRGDEHPRLKHWKGELDLGTLFAAGVLG